MYSAPSRASSSISSRNISATSSRNRSSVGYAPADSSGDQRLAYMLGLGSVTLTILSVRPRAYTNSSTERWRMRLSLPTTPRVWGRSVVLSPTASSPCHSPHSQASMSCSPKPSVASTIWLWKDSRRISPSVTTGRPARSCSPMAQSTARSSMRLNSAAESSPAAWRSRVSSSSCGLRRLPTVSARVVSACFTRTSLAPVRVRRGLRYRLGFEPFRVLANEEGIGVEGEHHVQSAAGVLLLGQLERTQQTLGHHGQRPAVVLAAIYLDTDSHHSWSSPTTTPSRSFYASSVTYW